MSAPLLLHVWPGRWGLPSIDAGCIEAILYLQLTFPNNYQIVETTDPDASPSGQLPFLVHGQLTVSSLPSIVSYLSGLDPAFILSPDSENVDENEADPSKADLDAHLSALHVSQATAWRAYVEAQLGDLVTHSLFVLDPNYRTFFHGLLASILPVPQRYYVPNRIRQGHRPRLEAVGLWQIANEPEEPETSDGSQKRKSEDKERKIKRAFGQVKLIEKARLVFDILARLLDEKSFIFSDRPTATDLSLASRILLLMRTPLPNCVLKDVLDSSYPTLTAHASRIYALAFPASSPFNTQPQIFALPRVNPLNVVKNTLVHLTRGAMTTRGESEEAKRFRRYRWGWFGLAIVGVVGFVVSSGVSAIEHAETEGGGEGEEIIIEDDDDSDDA